MARTIDHGSDRPAYRQIADHLRSAILSGEIPPGKQLPSERALMESYGAARGTVRQAIATLRAEGLIDIEHGRGAFARRRPPVRRLAYDRFARRHRDAGKAAYLIELEAEGRRPDVEVLAIGSQPASPDIAERLGLAEGTPVLVRRRRYLADGEPMEIATSYLPLSLVEGSPITKENTGPGGIYARLEELGHRLQRFTEDVTARMPLPEEVRALHLSPGVPVFVLVRTAAWRVPVLGVPRGLGPLLVLLLAAPDAQRIAGQVQHRILQHRRVAGREHERSRSNHSGSKRRNRVHNI